MKISKLKHDSYRVEINFGIGTQKEMTRWFTTKFVKNHKMEIPVKKNSRAEELIETISSTSGTSTYRIINKTTGFDQVVVIVNIDSRRNRPFIAKKDYKSLVKNIKTTFYHETRHAVDQIVKLRNLSYEDFENTAMLQAWINVEFEETLMDYITEGELEEVISESVKKRQEIKSYLLFFFTLNVPLNQDGKKEDYGYLRFQIRSVTSPSRYDIDIYNNNARVTSMSGVFVGQQSSNNPVKPGGYSLSGYLYNEPYRPISFVPSTGTINKDQIITIYIDVPY